MQDLVNLYIANNTEDLENLAIPEDLKKARNPQTLENVLKRLYKEILRETADQEKLYIFCFRYLHVIDKLCKISDAKFIKIKYRQEILRIRGKSTQLRLVLDHRYEEQRLQRKKQKQNVPKKLLQVVNNQPLFPGHFITAKELYRIIQDKMNVLIVDIRPENEFIESQINCSTVINIPEDIVVAGLSANALGKQLKENVQKIWDKRDTFALLVLLDWNSGSDDVTHTKLNYLRDSIVVWDCLRQYKQHPVIVNGGFKEFFESYPNSVTNVHVNFLRSNEDIDELLELDSISYPEPNVSVMQLKEFTIEGLEESAKVEQSNEPPKDDDFGEDKNNSHITSNVPNEDLTEYKEPLFPKGGGTTLNKDNYIIKPKPEESIQDIKSKIEEQRLKLLNEARNKKNKPLISSDGEEENSVQGDSTENNLIKPKITPPLIRRETKPQNHYFGGWCGLVNIKNTCYMNTVLQCLKCIPLLRRVVHSNINQYISRRPPQIINEFVSVIKTLCEGNESDKKIYRPSSFYEVICKLDSVYKKGNHEDCMEFFLFLFNHLNDDCAHDLKKKHAMTEREKSWYGHLQGRTSIWVDLFYYQFQCTKICQSCHLEATSYEMDNTLMLPVPFRPSLRTIHLKNLIYEYLEDNQILDYKCSRCQQMRVILKKNVVVAPEILVIVLKRYYQDEYMETRKNNVCVDFDFNIRFGNCDYKLNSIAQHRGTMDHGHYYAHGLVDSNLWIELNDERTVRFDGNWENVRGAACAFFYCKEIKKSKL